VYQLHTACAHAGSHDTRISTRSYAHNNKNTFTICQSLLFVMRFVALLLFCLCRVACHQTNVNMFVMLQQVL
jgi:hypothetical protein